MNQDDERKIMDAAVQQVATMNPPRLQEVARENFARIKAISLSGDTERKNQSIGANYETLVRAYALMGAALAKLERGLSPLSDKITPERNYQILTEYHMAIIRYSAKKESGLTSGHSPFYGHLGIMNKPDEVPQIAMLGEFNDRHQNLSEDAGVFARIGRTAARLSEAATSRMVIPRAPAVTIAEVPAAALSNNLGHS